MMPVFADTFFFLAVLNRRDSAHHAAVRWSRDHDRLRVTTAWVLAEVGDALAADNREAFVSLVRLVRQNPLFRLIEASQDSFDRGLALYARRPDKQWSLTDCISFVIMSDEGLTESLTGDHHYEQAGFTALFALPG